jgi:hypothetical protein
MLRVAQGLRQASTGTTLQRSTQSLVEVNELAVTPRRAAAAALAIFQNLPKLVLIGLSG